MAGCVGTVQLATMCLAQGPKSSLITEAFHRLNWVAGLYRSWHRHSFAAASIPLGQVKAE